MVVQDVVLEVIRLASESAELVSTHCIIVWKWVVKCVVLASPDVGVVCGV